MEEYYVLSLIWAYNKFQTDVANIDESAMLQSFFGYLQFNQLEFVILSHRSD